MTKIWCADVDPRNEISNEAGREDWFLPVIFNFRQNHLFWIPKEVAKCEVMVWSRETENSTDFLIKTILIVDVKQFKFDTFAKRKADLVFGLSANEFALAIGFCHNILIKES